MPTGRGRGRPPTPFFKPGVWTKEAQYIKIYLSVLILALGAVVQSAVAPHFAIHGLKAELVLALVVSWSILRGSEEGLVWAILGGLFLDLFSAAPFGASATAMALTALLVSWMGPSLSRANTLLPLALAPVATAVFNASSLTLLEAFGWNADWSFIALHVIAPLAALDFLLMVPAYLALSAVNRRLQPAINW